MSVFAVRPITILLSVPFSKENNHFSTRMSVISNNSGQVLILCTCLHQTLDNIARTMFLLIKLNSTITLEKLLRKASNLHTKKPQIRFYCDSGKPCIWDE